MFSKPPQTYVFDLDGVIYRGNEPQPHASQTVRELKRRNRRVFFFTNNATRSREDYLKKLTEMDVPVEIDEIMTSAYAAALYLKEHDGKGRRAYVVGEEGLRHELSLVGVEVVGRDSSERVDYVVAGLDRWFDYDKLTRAQQAILAGAVFIATNTDATFPIENGTVIPGGGAMVSAIEKASGVKPLVIGKPESYALEKILELAGSSPDESVMVGDRLETDILLGKKLGMPTVLPLTGVTDLGMLAEAPRGMRPDRIISDLIELLDENRSAN